MTWIRICFDLAALVGWLTMLTRSWQRPASRWRHGWAGKVLTLAGVALTVGWIAGWLLPYGALFVWWRDRGRRDDFELPMADGRRMR